MGFFQNLKDDLSEAMNELIGEDILNEGEEKEEEILIPGAEDSEDETDIDALADLIIKASEVTEDAEDKEDVIEQEELIILPKSETEEMAEPEEDFEEVEELSEISEEEEADIDIEKLLQSNATIGELIGAEELTDINEESELTEEIEEISEIEEVVITDVGTDESVHPEMIATKEECVEEEPETEEAEKIAEGEKEAVEIMAETEKIVDTEKEERAVSDETTIITKGTTIRGDLEADGNIELCGTVIGNVSALGKLDILGNITGNSKAQEIYAENAKVNGSISADGSVKIGQSSVIIGDVFATGAVIAGAVKGDLDVHGPVILDSSAIVKGNIKSQSVQINNGAVIEGMCCQCYATVNPSSFFEVFEDESGKDK
ncbi:MAG: polymer-forming cytoskeletal protein [Lachnospiraceae bacterium]|nr:polymer-forming cytoskeletal protein [Lachnospiraceae bacterium]